MESNNLAFDNLGLKLKKIDNELAECKTSEKSLRKIIKTLREERDFLEKVISVGCHPFYVLDANSFKIVMANTAAENLYGERNVNTLCYSWTHGRSTPCSEDNHPCPLEIIRNKKIPVILDHTHFDKMGRPLYFEIHAYPIFDEKGNVDKIVEYSLENTAFRRMEAAYKESEVRYEEIVENAHDIIQSILPDGSLAYVNRAWYEIMGYSEINLHSINFFDTVHPDSLNHCKEVFYRILEGKSGTHIPISFVAKSGKQIFLEGNIRPHFIEEKVDSVHGIFRDVTESINADKALRKNEKQLLKYSKHLERIIASLNVAKEVQQSLLPQNIPSQTRLDIAGGSLYCDETGGDYYDYFKLPNIGIDAYGIAVGDASGHGISSTLHMASVRAYLRSQASQGTSACKIISEVNRLFSRDTMESGNFMTIFFLIIETKSGDLNWVRAGNEPALLYDPFSDNFLKLEGQGLPLGVIADQQYRDYSLTLKPGQILVLTTDGLMEIRNVNGEMFGREKFVDIIRRNAGLGAEGIQTRVIEAVTNFQGEAQLEDDITLVILKLR